MKILFVDETAQLGGAEINLLMLVDQLHQLGWQVEIVLPQAGILAEKLDEIGVRVHYVPGVPNISLSFYWGKLKIPNPLAWVWNLFQGMTSSSR